METPTPYAPLLPPPGNESMEAQMQQLRAEMLKQQQEQQRKQMEMQMEMDRLRFQLQQQQAQRPAAPAPGYGAVGYVPPHPTQQPHPSQVAYISQQQMAAALAASGHSKCDVNGCHRAATQKCGYTFCCDECGRKICVEHSGWTSYNSRRRVAACPEHQTECVIL